MGVTPTLSCTPYLFPDYTPQRGDALAWAESSAVAFANSVIGARTNREGGPSALAAAITGRTARYGYHLDENRQANLDRRSALPGAQSVADFGALELPGRARPWAAACPGSPTWRDWLPAVAGRPDAGRRRRGDRLKTLGAGLAAYGAVALYHVAGYTPEARDLGAGARAPRRAAAGDRKPGRRLPRHGRRPRPAPDRPGDDRLPARQPERDRSRWPSTWAARRWPPGCG